MPRDVCHHKLTGAVLGTVLGTLLIIAGSAGTALAADDDGEGFYDQRLLRSFLRGLGLSNGREGTIKSRSGRLWWCRRAATCRRRRRPARGAARSVLAVRSGRRQAQGG